MVLCIDALPFPEPRALRNLPSDIHATKSVVVHNQIWFLHGIDSVDILNQKHHVYFNILDTETHGITTFDCETPCENGMTMKNLACDGHFLYILMKRTETNYRLLKFDTKSMSFAKNHVIEPSSVIIGHFVVQGNYLYYKELFLLKKLDLTDMSIKEQYELRPHQIGLGGLMHLNNTIYMVTICGNKREIVMFDDSLVPQKISEDMWMSSWRNFLFADGLFHQTDTSAGDNSIRNVIYTFDINTLEWHGEVDEDIQKVKHRMIVETVAKYEDRLYIFAANFVRVLDMKPKLSDICLTGIVKKMLGDPSQAARIMKKLPLPQRSKVKRMVQFRMEEAVFNSIFK